MANAKQIDRRVKLLNKWREESVKNHFDGLAKNLSPEQLEVFKHAYILGWNDLVMLMVRHGQFTDDFGFGIL